MKKRWTSEEIEFVRENYLTMGRDYCAKKIGKTAKAILHKASLLKLTSSPSWKLEDINFLKENYIKMGGDYCANILKMKRKRIHYKAASLGLFIKIDWNEEDLKFVEENFVKYGHSYCAKKLNRTESSIQHKATILGLKRKDRWTQDEIKILKENYPEKGLSYCIEHINRSKIQIKSKIKHLKLRKTPIPVAKKGNKVCHKCRKEKPLNDFSSEERHCRRCLADYVSNKRRTDPVFYIASKTRSRINDSFRNSEYGLKKSGSTNQLLACSFENYRWHLESKFTAQMNWDLLMKGEIEIHHIKPIYLFKTMDKPEQFEAFNYLNTEPLWKNNETARKYGDLTSEGHDERHARIDPILKATLPPHHPIVSASLPSQPEPSGDVPAFPFQKASEDRP